MTSDYSQIPLYKKLGIKPGHTVCVVNPPENFMETIGSQIHQARIVRGMVEDADIIHVFFIHKADLLAALPDLKDALGKQHALWISWPKKISGIMSDLNENVVREIGLEHGLVDVKVCAIDVSWSGLKFVYRLNDR